MPLKSLTHSLTHNTLMQINTALLKILRGQNPECAYLVKLVLVSIEDITHTHTHMHTHTHTHTPRCG